MQIYSIQKLIPEKSIVVFSPHFDDVLFMLGGYILELKNVGLLETKNFHLNLMNWIYAIITSIPIFFSLALSSSLIPESVITT